MRRIRPKLPIRAALLLSVLLAAAVSRAPAAAERPPTGRLDRLAASLQDEPAAVQSDFAAVALEQVILAHELEFGRLSLPGQVSRRELAKQMRWASALKAFLEDLYAVRDELDAGAEVEVLVAPPAPVQLLVGQRLVPLTAPRIDDPGALDSAIVELYCTAFPCDPALLEPPATQDDPAAVTAETGGWSFRDGLGSTYETVDGLGFMFPDVRRRVAKEQACLQVREALLRLVAVLAADRAAGRAVDWESLAVEPPAQGDARRVLVRTSGALLRLELPALARAPGVLAIAREWIRARVEGRDYRQLIPRADLMLAGLL